MSKRAVRAKELFCPVCGASYPEPERFCATCKLPLVYGDHVGGSGELDAVSEAHERARKIKPQLTEGPLVRVAWGRNQAEAEFIQGLLLEEGVPSLLRRSAGFDVPDFLAAGPRDVMVPMAAAQTAREVLLQAEIVRPGPGEPSGAVSPRRLLAGLLIALALGALVIWLMWLTVH